MRRVAHASLGDTVTPTPLSRAADRAGSWAGPRRGDGSSAPVWWRTGLRSVACVRPALRAERGQTAAEYLGMLLVVSVIIAAIAATDLPGDLRGAVAREICLIANDARDCPPSRAEQARRQRARERRAATRDTDHDHVPDRVERRYGTDPRSSDSDRDGIGDAAEIRAGTSGRATERRAASEPATAHAAGVPCDGMTATECSALRAMMNRARTEYAEAREGWLRYAADFAVWVAGAEKIKNVVDVVYRPGIFNAVNRLLRKQLNREGARLLTSVRNQPLENLIVSNYRYGAKIGKGSTADAVKHEVATGVAWGTHKSHYIKAVESIKRLNKIIARETLSAREKQIATNIRRELWDALPPHRRPPLQ